MHEEWDLNAKTPWYRRTKVFITLYTLAVFILGVMSGFIGRGAVISDQSEPTPSPSPVIVVVSPTIDQLSTEIGISTPTVTEMPPTETATPEATLTLAPTITPTLHGLRGTCRATVVINDAPFIEGGMPGSEAAMILELLERGRTVFVLNINDREKTDHANVYINYRPYVSGWVLWSHITIDSQSTCPLS